MSRTHTHTRHPSTTTKTVIANCSSMIRTRALNALRDGIAFCAHERSALSIRRDSAIVCVIPASCGVLRRTRSVSGNDTCGHFCVALQCEIKCHSGMLVMPGRRAYPNRSRLRNFPQRTCRDCQLDFRSKLYKRRKIAVISSATPIPFAGCSAVSESHNY